MATWVRPTQYESFAAINSCLKVMSEFSKVMENKVSEVNSENVADRFRSIAQGLGQGCTQYKITCV